MTTEYIRMVKFELVEVLRREGTFARRAELRLVIDANSHFVTLVFCGQAASEPGWRPTWLAHGIDQLIDLTPEPVAPVAGRHRPPHLQQNWGWKPPQPEFLQCATVMRLFAASEAKVSHLVAPSFYALLRTS